MRNVVAMLMVSYVCNAHAQSACVVPKLAEYEPIMSVDWSNLPHPLRMQAANEQSITIGPAGPNGETMLNVGISRTDDFSAVANGTPRAEVVLDGAAFVNDDDYILQWSTWLPQDFEVDSTVPEVITQILQHRPVGSPAISLLLKGNHYSLEVRSTAHQVARDVSFGNPYVDRGRTVCWRLHYVPDPEGGHAITELFKDDFLVFSEHGLPNMYAGNADPYLKMGIYKWAWMTQPDRITHRSISFGPVTLLRRKDQASH
jgi:hypothetical protein